MKINKEILFTLQYNKLVIFITFLSEKCQFGLHTGSFHTPLKPTLIHSRLWNNITNPVWSRKTAKIACKFPKQ